MSQTPSPLFLLSGFGMMLLAVAAVFVWHQGRPPTWRLVWLGGLAWGVSVALKFAWAVPTNKIVEELLGRLLGESTAKPLFWIYIGLLTGIFECGISCIVIARTRLNKADWNQGIAFGLGFGAMEAFILGALVFFGLLFAMLFFNQLSAEARVKVFQATSGSLAEIPLSIVERLTALLVHTFSCLLIVYAVRSRQARWFWFSFSFKSALDAFAMWGVESFQVKVSVVKLAQFNAMLSLFAAAAVAGIWMLKRRFQNGGPTQTVAL